MIRWRVSFSLSCLLQVLLTKTRKVKHHSVSLPRAPATWGSRSLLMCVFLLLSLQLEGGTSRWQLTKRTQWLIKWKRLLLKLNGNYFVFCLGMYDQFEFVTSEVGRVFTLLKGKVLKRYNRAPGARPVQVPRIALGNVFFFFYVRRSTGVLKPFIKTFLK